MGAFNGTIGLTYNPNKKWSVSVNTSTGYRAPNVDDIGKIFDFSAGDIVVPNIDLEAEYAYSAEASLSRIFWDDYENRCIRILYLFRKCHGSS